MQKVIVKVRVVVYIADELYLILPGILVLAYVLVCLYRKEGVDHMKLLNPTNS